MLKRILIIALSILILIGAGGCMKNEAEGYSKTQKQAVNKKKSYTNEEKKNMVLKYLKDKYDEEFEGISYKPAELLQGHDEFYMYSKSRTKEDVFQVWGSVQKDGTYKMRDGYFGIIIHDEYEKAVNKIVGGVYIEFKIRVNTTIFPLCPDRLNKLTKIDDIYDKNEFFVPEIWLYIKKSSTKGIDTGKVLQDVAQKLVDMKLTCIVYTYVINDDKYKNVENKEFEFTPENLSEKRKKFSITENLEIVKDWEAKLYE